MPLERLRARRRGRARPGGVVVVYPRRLGRAGDGRPATPSQAYHLPSDPRRAAAARDTAAGRPLVPPAGRARARGWSLPAAGAPAGRAPRGRPWADLRRPARGGRHLAPAGHSSARLPGALAALLDMLAALPDATRRLLARSGPPR